MGRNNLFENYVLIEDNNQRKTEIYNSTPTAFSVTSYNQQV